MSDDLKWTIVKDASSQKAFLQIIRKGEAFDRIEFDPAPLLDHLKLSAQRIALQNGKLVIEVVPAEQQGERHDRG